MDPTGGSVSALVVDQNLILNGIKMTNPHLRPAVPYKVMINQ